MLGRDADRRTGALPPEIMEFTSLMTLIERGKAEGQIDGDDVRRAFEADQIPPTEWKNLLRILNRILDEAGVMLMISAPQAPQCTDGSVGARDAFRTSSEPTKAAAASALYTGVERLFTELGPPPDELLSAYRSELTGGGGSRR